MGRSGLRLALGLCGFVLLVAACGGEDSAASTTSIVPVVDTSAVVTSVAPATTPPATTTTAPPTTTAAPPAAGAPDILIAGEQGVLLLHGDGSSDTLVTDDLEFALDDSQGGLLFQIERGRRFYGEDGPTTVWWVPAGTADARELLVPGEGQDLTLYEARFEGTDLVIWYTRWEGSQPDDLLETLRRFDAASGTVTEIAPVAGWESGVLLSFGGDIIARTWYAEALCGMAFTNLAGEEIDFPAAPPGTLAGEECGDVADFGELSADGTQFAYVELVRDQGIVVSTDVVVVEVASGVEVARVVAVRPEQAQWRIADLDLAGDTLVVNRWFPDEDRFHSPLVVDLSGTEPVVMEPPIPGWARIVRSPLQLTGRVTVAP